MAQFAFSHFIFVNKHFFIIVKVKTIFYSFTLIVPVWKSTQHGIMSRCWALYFLAVFFICMTQFYLGRICFQGKFRFLVFKFKKLTFDSHCFFSLSLSACSFRMLEVTAFCFLLICCTYSCIILICFCDTCFVHPFIQTCQVDYLLVSSACLSFPMSGWV